MSEKEKEIQRLFEKSIPTLTPLQKERLLGFGEGLIFAATQNKPETGKSESK